MGGHAVEIIGYDDVAKAFIVKNSWGAGWGESGFFRIAYSEVGGVTQFGSGTMAFQPSSACFYMLSSAGGGFSQTGGSSSFNVGTLKSCSWTASSNASWAALTGGSSGTGNGTVSYSVANNSGLARSATITAAGQSYNVSQAECAYSLSSTNATFTRKGGKGSFNVVNSGGCSWPWTASNNGISWITITSGFSGTGNGTVSFSVPSHTGKLTRSGAITVADQVFNITQN